MEFVIMDKRNANLYTMQILHDYVVKITGNRYNYTVTKWQFVHMASDFDHLGVL